MKPAHQTLFGSQEGNCWAACIASILELPVAEVPNLGVEPDWLGATYRWLQPRGYTGLYYGPYSDPPTKLIAGPSVWHIVSGTSPRDPNVLHAVVAFGDELRHDPHPSAAFIVGPVVDRFVIVPREVVR